MAKSTSQFVCQECGGIHGKWTGRCDACGAWNSIVEEAVATAPKAVSSRGGRKIEFVALDGRPAQLARRISGIAEFDRVCGGGMVPGSVLLVAGDPGIGKSTILLQVAASLARSGTPCAYVSGEEAVDQVRLRAQRLGLADTPVDLAAATNIRDILASFDGSRKTGNGAGTRTGSGRPQVLIIDSIQTMYVDLLDSAPGTVGQVRACAQELIRLAKRSGVTVILVGHVTKEGAIAGPKVLEHMVDTVLYFEGERAHQFRILRTVKNRFGPTDEIGVFEMTGHGLAEVANPSSLFLADRQNDVSGTAVFAGIEGTRPVLVEIQALAAPSSLGTPRRSTVGWDNARLAMLLAVLETRCGIAFADRDVYLNVAGGLRVGEPAADLAVAAAIISSYADKAGSGDTVVFGEIGLSGEVRAVTQTDLRLKEAAKLGFTRAVIPKRRHQGDGHERLEVRQVGHISELVNETTENAT
ncbi:MAG: DNA repair protein RadA [Alphaproteobacteria bacterium]|nr:DNA repair protein RadA [Alphaproteobacteria bacterium]